MRIELFEYIPNTNKVNKLQLKRSPINHVLTVSKPGNPTSIKLIAKHLIRAILKLGLAFMEYL